MTQGGKRPGAGRKKKATAYGDEATKVLRLPSSLAQEITTLLAQGEKIKVVREAVLLQQEATLKAFNTNNTTRLKILKEELKQAKDSNEELVEQLQKLAEENQLLKKLLVQSISHPKNN